MRVWRGKSSPWPQAPWLGLIYIETSGRLIISQQQLCGQLNYLDRHALNLRTTRKLLKKCIFTLLGIGGFSNENLRAKIFYTELFFYL